MTGFAWPDRIDDPLIGLFLLICDLSMNPTRGFPFALDLPENMIDDIDPGIRFTNLCFAARRNPALASGISSYSLENYTEVAAALSYPCGYDHPSAALKTIVDLIDNDAGAAALLRDGRPSAIRPPISRLG